MTQLFKTEAAVMVATAGRVDSTNDEVQGELTRLHLVIGGVHASRSSHPYIGVSLKQLSHFLPLPWARNDSGG